MNKELEIITEALMPEDILIQLAEESSELSQACLKLIRSNGNNNKPKVTHLKALDNLHEEVADVLVVMKVLNEFTFFDMDKVEEIANAKMTRWSKRLQGDWEK